VKPAAYPTPHIKTDDSAVKLILSEAHSLAQNLMLDVSSLDTEKTTTDRGNSTENVTLDVIFSCVKT